MSSSCSRHFACYVGLTVLGWQMDTVSNANDVLSFWIVLELFLSFFSPEMFDLADVFS